MKTYYIKDGKTKQVKNLGWLRHYYSKVGMNKVYLSKYPTFLEVFFADGTIYHCDFADYMVMQNWIKKPSFSGVKIAYINNVPEFKIIG